VPTSAVQRSAHHIRVLIVDDHAVVRTGLRFFVLAFDDLELVGEAASGKQALQLCADLNPDVILMDLAMPGMDGISATRALRRHCPNSQIIALSSFYQEHMVRKVLEAGAISYLPKDTSADELADAIRAAWAARATP
jgi:NarL family two-component system response regulator LiaR